MHLHEVIRGQVAILELRGDLWDENDLLDVQQKVKSLMVDGIKKVIFDLSSLHYINSMGLETLLNVLHRMREAGGDIRFARIDRQLDNVFVQRRLVRDFVTYETVGRALASFMI